MIADQMQQYQTTFHHEKSQNRDLAETTHRRLTVALLWEGLMVEDRKQGDFPFL